MEDGNGEPQAYRPVPGRISNAVFGFIGDHLVKVLAAATALAVAGVAAAAPAFGLVTAVKALGWVLLWIIQAVGLPAAYLAAADGAARYVHRVRTGATRPTTWGQAYRWLGAACPLVALAVCAPVAATSAAGLLAARRQAVTGSGTNLALALSFLACVPLCLYVMTRLAVLLRWQRQQRQARIAPAARAQARRLTD